MNTIFANIYQSLSFLIEGPTTQTMTRPSNSNQVPEGIFTSSQAPTVKNSHVITKSLTTEATTRAGGTETNTEIFTVGWTTLPFISCGFDETHKWTICLTYVFVLLQFSLSNSEVRFTFWLVSLSLNQTIMTVSIHANKKEAVNTILGHCPISPHPSHSVFRSPWFLKTWCKRTTAKQCCISLRDSSSEWPFFSRLYLNFHFYCRYAICILNHKSFTLRGEVHWRSYWEACFFVWHHLLKR